MRPVLILTLLFLTVCAACSTKQVIVETKPPEILLAKAEPLPRTNVVTTNDIVKRALAAEHRYTLIAAQLNSLIDWIVAETP